MREVKQGQLNKLRGLGSASHLTQKALCLQEGSSMQPANSVPSWLLFP